MNADKLAKALDELPAAYHQLPLFMLPGSRPEVGSLQHHSASNTRAPLVLTVVDLLDERQKDAEPTREDYELDRLAGARRLGVLPTLSSWVRLVDGQLWDSGHEHAAPADTPSVESECAWLRSHLQWIATQQWLDEITDDITSMLRDIEAIVGSNRPAKYTCLKPGCGWDVQPRENYAYYACTGCGSAWSGIEYRRELHRMAERKKPKTLKEISEITGIALTTLRRFHEKNHLKVVGRFGKAELFDLDAVALATMNLNYKKSIRVA